MFRKTLALILALLTLIPLAACSDNSSDVSGDPASDNTESAAAETEDPALADNLPEKDFDGYTFTTLAREIKKYYMEEEVGDVLDDAYFHRQRTVEERFNVQFKALCGPKNYLDDIEMLTSSVLAGDDVYDIAILHQIGAGPVLVTSQVIMDWSEIGYIDLSKPWWNQNINDTIVLAGRRYYIAGDITNPEPFCMFGNRQMMNDFGMKDIYSVVTDGEWTLDYMQSAALKVTADLDGNGTMNPETDRYGVSFNHDNHMIGFMYAADIESVIVDSNGKPVPNVNTERMQTLVEKMHDLVYKSGCTLYTDYDTATPLGFGGFKEGRVMAVAGYLANAYVTLRDTDIDFGLIPFPKFDEQQDGYKSYVMATNGVICVGKSATDTDRTGILVEAFAAETYKQVIPIYYDVALTNKYLRDEGSVDMLDIIRGGIVYDFGFVYDNWMGCTWILPNMMKEKQTSVEAYWAGIESKVSAWYESLYEAAADYSLD